MTKKGDDLTHDLFDELLVSAAAVASKVVRPWAAAFVFLLTGITILLTLIVVILAATLHYRAASK